jgi:hypothetical protein
MHFFDARVHQKQFFEFFYKEITKNNFYNRIFCNDLIRAFGWCVNCGHYLQSWFLNKLQFDLDQRPDSMAVLVKKRNVEHFYERSQNVMLSFSVKNERPTVLEVY